MTRRLASGWLEHARIQPSFFKRSLQNRFMEMMPALFSRRFVGVMACRGKNPLPAPFFAGVWIFSVETIGQGNLA